MNNRIEELAKQAWIEGGHDVHSGRKTAMEKFAELIIKDCTELTLDYKKMMIIIMVG